MHRNLVCFALTALILLGAVSGALGATAPYDYSRIRGPVRTDAFANPREENRVHTVGKMCMNITNYGYFGNSGPGQSDALTDTCTDRWAPQCEYPCGSGQQYLYQAGLWIGALIVEEGFETKRVSVGTDGWFTPSINEFHPGGGVSDGILERSTRPGNTNCLGVYVTDEENAVSDQDFVAVMTDTLNQQPFVQLDPTDGRHRPLGIKITQTSYAFSQAFAEDFILIDYEIENIASNFLKNLYVGLYVDSDVGPMNMTEQHTDDICGFLESTREANAQGDSAIIPIDVAWIADNDGRAHNQSSGPLIVPHVTGTRVIRGPNPRLRTSFNWWISNGDVNLDYGPSWRSYCDGDSNGLGWTKLYGTPVGDEHKYQVLSNSEFDFWQIMVNRMAEVAPQRIETAPGVFRDEPWCTSDPSPEADDIANGYDTRYLLSWGPLGIRDYQDASGRWIYRLNPGEKFNMTIAYVGGENFHDPNRPQPNNQFIDSSLFNFADLMQNARWSKDVYDNRMHDTPQYDWGNDHEPNTFDSDGSEGDGKLDTGDGWCGEDVGTDGIYAEVSIGFVPGVDSMRAVYFRGTQWEVFAGWYRGPDADGTERNGFINNVINPALFPSGAGTEDNIMPSEMYYLHPKLRYWDMGWMSGNGLLDMGDGLPDFTGPPPPPIPALLHCIPGTFNAAAHRGGIVLSGCHVGGLGYEIRGDEIILRWSKRSSEDPDYRDPFSRVQDFEGYMILSANVNQESDYSLLAAFDLEDYAYYSANDSMMSYPIVTTRPDTLPPIVFFGDTVNTQGIPGYLKGVGRNTGFDGRNGQNIIYDDSTYQFVIKAHKLAPRYYAIASIDFGDPKSGLGPLYTRPTANAVLLAPAGEPSKKVTVVPNPYRAYENYRSARLGISWENMNDGTVDFFAQQDRRIEFMNLPEQCLIRIFTLAGDLVQIVPHNVIGDQSRWASMTSEAWDLNSRNRQQVVSGIYLFSVEDMTDGNGHEIETGKFVIIR